MRIKDNVICKGLSVINENEFFFGKGREVLLKPLEQCNRMEFLKYFRHVCIPGQSKHN